MAESITSHGGERVFGSNAESQPAQPSIEAPRVEAIPVEVQESSVPATVDGLSRHRRWLISAVTAGTLMLGAGLAAVGLREGDNSDNIPSGGITTGIDGEYVPGPFVDRYNGLPDTENIFGKDNTKEISAAELMQYQSRKNLNVETVLLPIPFNPEGQDVKANLYKVSLDGNTPATTGILAYFGIDKGTKVVSPITGKIDVKDVAVENLPSHKLVTLTEEKDGKVVLLQMIVPVDVKLSLDPNTIKEVKAGDSLFQYGDTTVVSEQVGQSMEIHALSKKIGEEDTSYVTQGINVMADKGEAIFLK